VRKRLSVAVVAALLVLLAGLTLAARASGSSPKPSGSGAGAGQVTQPALSPIQRMVFDTGGEGPGRSDRAGSTDGVARGEGEDGHMSNGFCRLNL
jgi:hypothetical protein